MKAIYGLYTSPTVAQRAVDGLRAAGVPDAAIQVMSSEPFEEYEFSHRDKATWLHWVAGAGGLLGLAGGAWLTITTERSWPLVTSGMPIVATWPNLIVVFELTMLGAMLASVLALLVTAKLPVSLPVLYDREVSDGYILVGLQSPAADAAARVAAALENAGPGRVKTIE